MVQPILLDIPSAIDGWDAFMTTNIQILRDNPMPMKQYPNASALPAAASFDRCMAFKEITSGLNPGYRPTWSDGTTWRYIPDNTQAYFDDGAIRQGATPASAGAIRFSNTTDIKRRNNANSADLDVIKADTSDTVTVGSTGGDTKTPAGASSAVARIGGALNSQSTPVGNPGTTAEGDLMTYTLPANALSANEKGIAWELSGKFAANGNNKQLRIKFGSVTVFDSGVITDNNVVWKAILRVRRTASNAQKIECLVIKGTAIIASTISTATESDSGTIVMKATGQSGTSGTASDVTQEADFKLFAA